MHSEGTHGCPRADRIHRNKWNAEPVIALKVSREDVGQITGKHGRMVVAIRTILSAAFMILKKRYILDVLD